MNILPILRVFIGTPGSHPVLTLVCLIIAGIFNVLSISLIIPLLGTLSMSGASGGSGLRALGAMLLSKLSIAQSPEQLLLFIGVAFTLKSLFVLAAMTFVSHSVAAVGATIRRRLLSAILDANLKYFLAHPPVTIANAISNSATSAAEAFNNACLAISEYLKLAALLVAALLISGYLIFVLISAGAVFGFLLARFLQWRRKSYREQREVNDRLLGSVHDALSNIKVLRGMGRVGPHAKIMEAIIGRLELSVRQSQFTRHRLNAVQDISIVVAVSAGLYAGMRYLDAPLPEMLVMTALFFLSGSILKNLQGILHRFNESAPAFDDCEKLIAEADALRDLRRGATVPTLNHECRFENVSFAYDDRPVLQGVSFTIPAGGITVIEGASGSGKTTAVDLLIGLYAPQSGRILIDETPLDNISIDAWRSSIGYVPQELILVPGTIFENVALGDSRVTREDACAALKLAGAASFVNALAEGLDTEVGNMGTRLSGGQRQRISIARALVAKPSLLILDEVTSALDRVTEAEICGNVKNLSGRMTIVAITHREAWRAIATHAVVIKGGRIVPGEGDGNQAGS